MTLHDVLCGETGHVLFRAPAELMLAVSEQGEQSDNVEAALRSPHLEWVADLCELRRFVKSVGLESGEKDEHTVRMLAFWIGAGNWSDSRNEDDTP
jgi:hypothetical protein